MNFFVISLFPEMIEQSCSFGVLGRAIRQGLISVRCVNPRDFTKDRHRTVDDRPYGGGPGMLMKWQPLADAIQAAKDQASGAAKVIYMSPQGALLNQQMVQRFAEKGQVKDLAVEKQQEPVSAEDMPQDLILIAGRYEGIDERLIEKLVDEECSIGDYIISGGEMAAMIVIDAVARLCPGVLGDKESAQQDSFMQGLLDHPHYTRPEEINGDRVPEVLLSGDHKAIAQWRLQQALGRTWLRRPALIAALKAGVAIPAKEADTNPDALSSWDENKEKLLAEFINKYIQSEQQKPDIK